MPIDAMADSLIPSALPAIIDAQHDRNRAVQSGAISERSRSERRPDTDDLALPMSMILGSYIPLPYVPHTYRHDADDCLLWLMAKTFLNQQGPKQKREERDCFVHH